MAATAYERLLINTQILQFAAVNFNGLIQNFQQISERNGYAEDRLIEMIDLHNKINSMIEAVRDELLNTLDGWDALSDIDLAVVNPMIEFLNNAEQSD